VLQSAWTDDIGRVPAAFCALRATLFCSLAMKKSTFPVMVPKASAAEVAEEEQDGAV
jgi:hypothetical protein